MTNDCAWRRSDIDLEALNSPERVVALLRSSPTQRLWPTTGLLLDLSRPATFRAAKTGAIRCLSLGRSKRVPSSWLAEVLGLDLSEVNGTSRDGPPDAPA